MNKFSIIIPCFNAGEYLERCLKSILCQNYQEFEIIIVNDGSTDNSLDIIKKYVNKFSNIKFINQKNRGVAIARNVGINAISGNRFLFVDADDYISPNLLDHLNETLKTNSTDIVRYNANLIKDNNIDKSRYFCEKFSPMDGKAALKLFVDKNIRYGPLWLYCYDTSFYKKNGFSFIENKIHEDFYNIFILSKAKSIQGIDYIGYNYEKNNTGITANKDKKQELNRAKDIIYVYDVVIRLLKESFCNNQEDFYHIYDNLSGFLNNALKYLEDSEKEFYLKEIESRKRNGNE